MSEPLDFFVKLDESYASQEEFFRSIATELYESNHVSNQYATMLTNREMKYPTGLETRFCSVAIPHTDASLVRKPFIYFIRLKDALTFYEMSGSNDQLAVKLIFLIGITANKDQVPLLANIMSFLSCEEKVETCLVAQNQAELQPVFTDIIEGRRR